MTAYAGEEVLLKIGNAATPELFAVVGGLRGTNFRFNQNLVETTNKESGAWRALLEFAGVKSLQIEAGGMFTDSTTEAQLRQAAMSGVFRNFQILFGNGDYLQGRFKITRYARGGVFQGEETYQLMLESSGEISFTEAA